MYTQGHHNNVYPGYIRYTSDLDKHQQCVSRVHKVWLWLSEAQAIYTLGHINNVYPGYIRYSDIDKHQQCIPLYIIKMCIQST